MKKLLLITSLMLLSSSSSAVETVMMSANGLPETPTAISTHKEVQWFQQSAERVAIDREVFLATENTIKQQILTQKLKPKQWGVIMDIDETLLDNSAWNYQHHINHTTQTWDQFAALAKSTAIPGAVEFTQHIHQMGGYISLVSNRTIELLKPTQQNLKTQHIYYDQILLDTSKQGTSFVDKNQRFTNIAKGQSPSTLPPQKIVAWLGDNIQDFPELKQSELTGNPTKAAFNQFGKTYFAFPNPMYGSWEAK